MIIIRFQPKGKKHSKFYRIVTAEKKRHVSKKFLEILGWYNPYTKEVKFNNERIKHYLQNNTEVSQSVSSLFKKHKIIN
ncbi:30S ribosomal protein S16 [Candidatus Gracilibacteria bacterium]|nr:30S ribosomal protein S16 [Candidatus Gracilibacteria bacterium]